MPGAEFFTAIGVFLVKLLEFQWSVLQSGRKTNSVLWLALLPARDWPFRNSAWNWAEFQILTNRLTDTTTWKFMLRLLVWRSVVLLGWTEIKLWALKNGSKYIQTFLILRQRPPKSYKLFKFFMISVILFEMGNYSDFHLSFFQITGTWRDFTVVTKLIKTF